MNDTNLTLVSLILASVVVLGTLPLPGMSQLMPSPSNVPTIVDTNSNLVIEEYASGLNFSSSMAFLGHDDILVLEKNSGQVR